MLVLRLPKGLAVQGSHARQTGSAAAVPSLDCGSLAELATGDTWSNEGLFAHTEGLRWLRRVGGDRVRAPDTEWTVS